MDEASGSIDSSSGSEQPSEEWISEVLGRKVTQRPVNLKDFKDVSGTVDYGRIAAYVNSNKRKATLQVDRVHPSKLPSLNVRKTAHSSEGLYVNLCANFLYEDQNDETGGIGDTPLLQQQQPKEPNPMDQDESKASESMDRNKLLAVSI
ncbi:uncharacterized protein [Amphiura filiformis]|uniref:uncharacterized protein n=1 Tax=Amphiura filiformis TaxID=82378 RepID=UPI003B226BD0